MSTPEPRMGPTVPRIMLGSRLRKLREDAALTREEAGYAIRAHETKISRMELGRVGCQTRDVTDLADCYGLIDTFERKRLVELARAGRKRQAHSDLLPDWAATYFDLEEAASRIRTYEIQFIPGLLQTAEYARAVIAEGHPGNTADDIERRVAVRMNRTHLLLRPDPPRLWAVVDEGALRRRIGGRAVMRAQLERLLEAAKLPNITLQVMSAVAGGHAAEGGAFALLRFPYPELPDVVHIEHLTRGFLLDDTDEVETYAQAAEKLAVQAATPNESLDILATLREEV